MDEVGEGGDVINGIPVRAFSKLKFYHLAMNW